MSTTAASDAGLKRLPPMREDLVLSEGPRDPSGVATWRIYDPLRHRYIAIDELTRRALDLWRDHATAHELAGAIGRNVALADVEGLVTFLRQNSLLQEADEGDWRRGWAAHQGHRHGVVMQMVHNYLFFRVPLFAPDEFLRATARLVEPLFSRRLHYAVASLGLVGLFLVSRQWEVFLADARMLTTASGLVAFGIMLFVVKILHEFGHAYTAVRHGCRVPVIGIAFMMMAPVLYTDVTDSWRLKDRRKRIAIDAAGVIVELGIACLATFLWVFLPEGAVRQITFLLATSSWTMSVAINLNPFMRFDGYYIASDLLGVENLQTRAFDFGIWRMREILFGLRQPPPEQLPANRQRVLIAYAWSVWLSRLIMFTGIAVTVYAYFFKALGVGLFLFEIGYFIAKPLYVEVRDWVRSRQRIIRSRRTLVTASATAAVMLLLVVPWSSDVRAPAVLEAAETAKIFPSRPAQVVEVVAKLGQPVWTGDVLIRLAAPELDSEHRIAASRLASLDLRLARASADKEDRDERQVLISSRVALAAKLDGIARERAELVVQSPIDGVVSELDPATHVGRWVGMRDQLVLVRGTTGYTLTGYLREADLWRVVPGGQARFIPEMPLAPRVDAVLTRVAHASAAQIDQAELAVPNGGSIEVQSDGHGSRLVPSSAHYQLSLNAFEAGALPAMRLRGVLHIDGEAESFLSAAWRHVLKVFVRESAA